MDGVEVQGEDYEEVKDGQKREKPRHAWPDSCNYVVTITERCNDCDPYLDDVRDFTVHFLSLSLSVSDIDHLDGQSGMAALKGKRQHK